MKAKTERTITRDMVGLAPDRNEQANIKLPKYREVDIVMNLQGTMHYLDILVRWVGNHIDVKDGKVRSSHDNYLWVNHSWLGEFYE